MVLKIYLQGSNGETDIENRLLDMGRGEERVRCLKKNAEERKIERQPTPREKIFANDWTDKGLISK